MRPRLRSSFLADRGERLFGLSQNLIATPLSPSVGAKEAATDAGHTSVAAKAPSREAAKARQVNPPAGRAETSAWSDPAGFDQMDPAPAAEDGAAGAGHFFAGIDLGAGDDMTAIALRVSPQMLILIQILAAHDRVSVDQAIADACAHRARYVGLGALARAALDEQERSRAGVSHGRHNADRAARRHENSLTESSRGFRAPCVAIDELADVPAFARPNTSRFPKGDK